MSSQVKLNKNVTIGIIVGAVLIVLGIIFLRPSDHDKIRKGYGGLDDTHIFETISYKELQELGSTEIGNYLVVLAKHTCGGCQVQLPYIDDVAKDNGFKVVYYLNPEDLSSSNKSDFESTYGVKSTTTPNLLVLNNNKLVGSSVEWFNITSNSDSTFKDCDNCKLSSDGSISWKRSYEAFIKEFAV